MENDPNIEAPPKLVHAFKQLRSKPVVVPRSVDDIVLDAARQRLERPAGWRWWIAWSGWSSWVKGPAVAAACLLLVVAARYLAPPDAGRFVREDLNRDGQVDIRDAFDLARQLKAGVRLPAEADLNGDGVVDRLDAEAIAREAVSLEKGGDR